MDNFIIFFIVIAFVIILGFPLLTKNKSHKNIYQYESKHNLAVEDFLKVCKDFDLFENILRNDFSQPIPYKTMYLSKITALIQEKNKICNDFIHLAEQCKSEIESKKIKNYSSYEEQYTSMITRLYEIYEAVSQLEPIMKVDTENIQVESESINSPSFFSGCHTKEEVAKRYKALVKVYHPDSGVGDEDTFKKIKDEYEKLRKSGDF